MKHMNGTDIPVTCKSTENNRNLTISMSILELSLNYQN
jgi:hypothetical protein